MSETSYAICSAVIVIIGATAILAYFVCALSAQITKIEEEKYGDEKDDFHHHTL